MHRQIASELHDSMGPHLVAASLSLTGNQVFLRQDRAAFS
ncbi:hypothetical protein JJC00_12545 [Bradyrhizobium diazoefficiens]|nr:hypothetical protein JJC00_12545 [Bradyrhizobium diazoefficiens]